MLVGRPAPGSSQDNPSAQHVAEIVLFEVQKEVGCQVSPAARLLQDDKADDDLQGCALDIPTDFPRPVSRISSYPLSHIPVNFPSECQGVEFEMLVAVWAAFLCRHSS